MNYFNSKYFAVTGNTPNDRAIEKIKAQVAARKEGRWVTEFLELYMTEIHFSLPWVADANKIVAEWELVEDMSYHFSVKKDPKDLNESDDAARYLNVYYYEKLECFAAIAVGADSNFIEIHIPLGVTPVGVFQTLVDDGYINYEKQESIETPKIPNFGMLVKGRFGYDIKFVPVRDVEIDLDLHYGDGFTSIADKMIELTSVRNGSGLIILRGIPGTGKTSLLRWLSAHADRRFVYIPTETVHQLSETDFVDFLINNRGLTFIVEDAETILMSREDGASNSQVSSILNMTDGIQGDIFNSQFICTFNTSVDKIDPALLRPGRLLLEHEFKALSVDNANRLLIEQGKDARVTEPTTLATLMNL